MKKIGFLLLFALSVLSLHGADVNIESGKDYQFVCENWQGSGRMVLGRYHGSTAYVFYDISADGTAADCYWTVTASGQGYTIRNAKSGEYLVYVDGQETDGNGNIIAKGLRLSAEASGDNARWTFGDTGQGSLYVANLAEPGQYFNVRTDNSNTPYLVGTYRDYSAANGFFNLYDSEGNSVLGNGAGQGSGNGVAAFRSVVDSIRVGGKDLVYDVSAGEYFCAVPPSVEDGGTFSTTLEWRAKAGSDISDYTIEIGGATAAADGSVSIAGVSGRNASTLRLLHDGKETASVPLNFTFLPIVEVTLASCNGSTYTEGRMRVTDPGTAVYDSTLIAAFRYRGASAQNYVKKSYAIKLRDAAGNSVDREFFGLRDDNNWILDAMAVDHACMRNRVSTDLWNDFSTKPYYVRAGLEKKARTGTRGRFVEVFLNGSYHGLYCMTEKMDRKQLKLKKYDEETGTVHGTLFKSDQWNYEVLMGHEVGQRVFPRHAPAAYNNDLRQETWRNYEVKYPDWEEEKIDWGPLWNAINMTATSTHRIFETQYDRYFDTPVIDDYYLFIELMLATDNHGKNMYFFNYDQKNEQFKDKIGIAPWDLDGTWGIRWDGSTNYTAAEQDFDTHLWQYEWGTHTIFYHLQNSPSRDWFEELSERYAELRPNYFSPESLEKRFRDYAELFERSGADRREQNRWRSNGYHSDIQAAVDYICTWIEDRVKYLDKYYDYKDVPSGIGEVESDEDIVVTGGNGSIVFKTQSPVSISVYTADGRLARSLNLQRGMTVTEGFAPGIYMAGGKKVAVR